MRALKARKVRAPEGRGVHPCPALSHPDTPNSAGLTHAGPLAEGHKGAEDAAHRVRALLNGEASLQLQRPLVVHHPEGRMAVGQGVASALAGSEQGVRGWWAMVCVPTPRPEFFPRLTRSGFEATA